jgi:subtilisin
MRRSLAAFAAAVLLLSSVGTAIGVQPDASGGPAPILRPSPSAEPAPSASASPSPSANPSPSAHPAPDPTAAPPADPVAGPSDPAASSAPERTADRAAEPATASVVPAVAPPAAAAGSAKGKDSVDPTDRWIVVLEPGTDVPVTAARQGRRIGFVADRTYGHAIKGYAAKLDRAQVTALSRDPAVALIVADERIESEAQLVPTGISRIGANRSSVAKIDGLDDRVDADVAIVDTGITSVPDLNVAGGYNCSTSDRAAWRDVYGHGTHVAGTVGALDNGSGVVGVAPGVRLWAVKILNDSGDGLLSWYVCGLDWIAAQRDPTDATRPLFEAVNMSVAKWGKDDLNCGLTNNDVLHAAICRLVRSGVTVVAAAGNDASSAAARVPAAYNEVITVSALADTDGKPGGLGGNRCYSWGTYDLDDTFADFSNRGTDIDLIAPGKCIWSTIPGGYAYMSGTSMAAPHVAGAIALLKATRPNFTPGEVKEALQYLGTYGWKTWTDPDGRIDRLLDTSRIGPRGDFTMTGSASVTIGEAGGKATFAIGATRSTTSFERIKLSVAGLPPGATAVFSPTSLYGFTGGTTLTVTVPFATADGSWNLTVTGDEHGNARSTTVKLGIVSDDPVARPPSASTRVKDQLGTSTVPVVVWWPLATDKTTGIAGYELQVSVDGGAWLAAATTSTIHSIARRETVGHAYAYQVRARDGAGHWSPWAVGPTATPVLLQDTAGAVSYAGTWRRASLSSASGGTTTWSSTGGARAGTTFWARGIAVVAPTGPTRGAAWLYVDGVFRASLSFRSSTSRSRVVMYSLNFPTRGTHTITMRLSGSGRVDLDAFVILR